MLPISISADSPYSESAGTPSMPHSSAAWFGVTSSRTVASMSPNDAEHDAGDVVLGAADALDRLAHR